VTTTRVTYRHPAPSNKATIAAVKGSLHPQGRPRGRAAAALRPGVSAGPHAAAGTTGSARLPATQVGSVHSPCAPADRPASTSACAGWRLRRSRRARPQWPRTARTKAATRWLPGWR